MDVEDPDSECGAVQEMEEPGVRPGGPPRPPCRRRPQTTVSCCG